MTLAERIKEHIENVRHQLMLLESEVKLLAEQEKTPDVADETKDTPV